MPDSGSGQPTPVSSPLMPAQSLSPLAPLGAPASHSNSKVAKAVLITVGIFVGLGVLAVGAIGFATWYFAISVHNVPSATFTEHDLGIAIYPGAEPSLVGSRAQMAGTTMLKATYYTADPVEKVLAFYKEKAGPAARPYRNSKSSGFHVSGPSGDKIAVGIMRVPGKSGGMTYIVIEHVIRSAPAH